MSSDTPKEPPYIDPFYEKRVDRLQLLDSGVRTCKQNGLSPSVEQLEEAVQIGYDLLENLHQNNIQERLHTLMGKALALVKSIEEQPKVLHVDMSASEEKTLLDAMEKDNEGGRVELVEIDDSSNPPSLLDLLGIDTGRIPVDKPNPCGCRFKHTPPNMGRVSSNKPNFKEIDRKEEKE